MTEEQIGAIREALDQIRYHRQMAAGGGSTHQSFLNVLHDRDPLVCQGEARAKANDQADDQGPLTHLLERVNR
jgi:hypothetical protein